MDSAGNSELKLRGCSQIALVTGNSATSLRELRDQLKVVPTSSIYQHFWGRLLLPHFAEPEYNNDFASWAFHSLQDKTLAERLSAVNPLDFDSPESLRQELIELVEARLEEREVLSWRQADHPFFFQFAQMVVFDANLRIDDPAKLSDALKHVPEGTIYYHFIDARRRNADHSDDFSNWLRDQGPKWREKADAVSKLDPYFSTLNGIRHRLIATLEH